MPAAITEDLFPRGHARGQPRFFKKRAKAESGDTQGLEGVQGGTREPERARRRKLTPGSTVLAVVTRCDESAVYFELPSGTRASADPMETPCEGGAPYFIDAVAAANTSDMEDEDEKEDTNNNIPLYKVLHVGQVVRAAVISSSNPSSNTHAGSKKLEVSLKPALINSRLNAGMLRVKGTHLYGAVKSVEDHGYVLDFGPIPTTGFLPFKDAPIARPKPRNSDTYEYEKEEDDDDGSEDEEDNDEMDSENLLLPGTPLEVVVSQSQKSLEKKKNKQSKVGTSALSTVRCCAISSTVSKAETLMYDGLTFFELCAGMRVAAKVLTVSSARVTATVFGLFTIFIDSVHVPVNVQGELDVKVGASVSVRLLSVDPNQKLITASLLRDVVEEFRIPRIDDKCKIGTIVRNLQVDRIESNFGLYLKKFDHSVVADGDDNNDGNINGVEEKTLDITNVPLFAHISRVSEKRIDSLEKLYHIGKKIKLDARIVSISKFDGVINVDLRPRIIKRAALDLNEVKPGTCYNCTVLSHLSSGNLLVAVDGDPNITGLIPKMHISDTFISPKTLTRHPTLRSGGVVKCVALSKDEERGALYLSAKKSLVNSTDPLLLSYKQADKIIKKQDAATKKAKKEDMQSFVGSVLRVFESLMLVQFCNQTIGSVHFKDLGLEESVPSAEPGNENRTKKKKKRKRSVPEQKKVVIRTQKEIEELYPVGQTVRVNLVRMDYGGKGKRRLICSMNGSPVSPEGSQITPGVKSGCFFQASVRIIDPARGITVLIPKEYRTKKSGKPAMGFVGLYDVADDFDHVESVLAKIKKNDFIRVLIVNATGESVNSCLTMRETDHLVNAKDPVRLPQHLPLEEGLKVRGFIHSVTKFGAFVDIGRGIRARIKLSNLSDEYLQNPEEAFPRGKLVSGKVVSEENSNKKKNKGQVEMSLRTKEKRAKKNERVTQFKEGDVVKGTVNRVESFGVIMKLSSGGTALLHMTEADDERVVKNPHDEWTTGQGLTAVVIESKAKGIKVSLKRSYFEAAGLKIDEIEQIINDNAQGSPEEEEKEEGPTRKKARSDSSNFVQQALEIKPDADDVEMVEEESEDDNVNNNSNSDSDLEESEDEEEMEDAPVLNINHSFSILDEEEKESESEEDEVKKDGENESEKDDTESTGDPEFRKKKSKKEQKAKKREKEAAQLEIEKKEEALASDTHGPETAEDFERMLLAEPNSSAVWIRYMAFRLSLQQEDLARAVAEKALERIVMEKEVERVNIWMAYINLEASCNNSNSKMQAAAILRVFDRAIKRITDVEDFYLQVFENLKTSAPAVADEIMKRGLRKFRDSKEVWVAAGKAKYEKGEVNAARKILENALRALENKKYHVYTIMKYSLFEYKYGSVERGRTNFESLVGNYPKKLDIWNVFLDSEIAICRNAKGDNAEAVEETRLKFERCASLTLSTKKMKSVFVKWLQFEKEFGDDASHRDVLSRAKAYVEGKTGAAE